MSKTMYRGRIAPSPTGYLHIGHAMTFRRAQERARAVGGKVILRIEDLDGTRCRPEFAHAIISDLKWFGLEWDEGPDLGGPFAPYLQSGRRALYLDAWRKLRAGAFIYPCRCSRRDVLEAGLAPHDENEEPLYPGTCRPENAGAAALTSSSAVTNPAVNWRFRVPDGVGMEFVDQRLGRQHAVAGKHFGDFVIWRRDDLPAYQLAVVVDDSAMQVTEVVRGEDLLLSTFRQLLIYRALNLSPPAFYHASLILDQTGKRLAKRHGALSLKELHATGVKPEDIHRRVYVSGG